MKKSLVVVFLLSILIVNACSPNANIDGNVVRDVAQNPEPAQLERIAKNYYRFDQAVFDQAIADNKIVFLDFRADWCPICQKEKPEILAAFNSLDNDNLIGFEVHWQDGKDTPAEQELAKKYGITLQHTKIIIKDGEVAFRSLEAFTSERVINEINKVA